MYYSCSDFKRWKAAFIAVMMTALCVLFCSCGQGSDSADPNRSGHSDTLPSASQDNAGDPSSSSDPMERLAGTYYIDGEPSAAYVEITTDGSFTAYYASGNVERTGYVRYKEDNSNQSKTFYVYVFYTDEGNPYMGFVDSGEARISEFETGNGSVVYKRIDN